MTVLRRPGLYFHPGCRFVSENHKRKRRDQ